MDTYLVKLGDAAAALTSSVVVNIGLVALLLIASVLVQLRVVAHHCNRCG